MRWRTIVWKELRERPTAVLTCGAVVILGVAALVAIRHICEESEREVSRQLSSLGANILILPKESSLQDYYSADQNGRTLPEEHASTILFAALTGVEKLSPRLSVESSIGEHKVILTGILPQSEWQAKSTWQTASLLGRKKHQGCARAKCGPTENASPDALLETRSIEDLRFGELIVGADVDESLPLAIGENVTIRDAKFTVTTVLPRTGTVDDGRVFAHLHQVQGLANAGEMVSAIEVIGCCEDAAGDLVPELEKLLPDTKVVTVAQLVRTQVGVNQLMARTSWFVLGVVVLAGSASVAGSVAANVRERRKEIGTLMALGATPGGIFWIFLMKAFWVGLVGGVAGCLLGIGLAVGLGPQWAGVAVEPNPLLAVWAVLAATVLAVGAAAWPARHAAMLDPCTCFREV